MSGWLNNWEDTAAKLGKVSRRTVTKLWAAGEDGSPPKLGSVMIGSRRFSTDGQIAEYIAGLEKSA